MRQVVITPNWENTAAYFATALVHHDFDYGAREPVVSFIEQVRYLALNDPAALERVIARVKGGGR